MSEGRVRISGFWLLTIIIVGILIVGDLTRRMTDARRMEREAATLSAEVVELEAANAELESLIANAGDDASVAEWARAEAKLIRDGETLVIPIPAEGTEIEILPELEPLADPPSSWEVWLALLIGG